MASAFSPFCIIPERQPGGSGMHMAGPPDFPITMGWALRSDA
jgi:hypothetical protein